MYTIRKIETHLSDSQKEEILKLLEENADDIETYIVKKESPFYKYISILLVEKTKLLLLNLQVNTMRKMHLIVCENSLGNVIGFLLYHERFDSDDYTYKKQVNFTDDVTISSVAVDNNYRQKGIFTKMVNFLKSNYKSIGLTCSIERVSLYEKLGFCVSGLYQTHIVMIWGNDDGSTKLWSIDDDFIRNLHPARFALQMIQTELGSSFKRLLDSFNRDNDREKKRAEKFIKNYKLEDKF